MSASIQTNAPQLRNTLKIYEASLSMTNVVCVLMLHVKCYEGFCQHLECGIYDYLEYSALIIGVLFGT